MLRGCDSPFTHRFVAEYGAFFGYDADDAADVAGPMSEEHKY
jgi:hypothetical protein